jgi:hypothetical protein
MSEVWWVHESWKIFVVANTEHRHVELHSVVDHAVFNEQGTMVIDQFGNVEGDDDFELRVTNYLLDSKGVMKGFLRNIEKQHGGEFVYMGEI